MNQNTIIEPSPDKIDQLNQHAWDIRVSDSTMAHSLSKEAVEHAKSINYQKGKAEGLRTLGFCFIRLSKHEEALEYLKESLFLFESLNDLRGQSTVYEYFGIIQRSWGNLGSSLELLLKSLGLSQQTGFVEAEITNLYQVGVTYKQLGNYEKALEYLYNSLSLARSTQFTLMEAYDINVIGSIYFETSDFKQALDYYQQGLAIRQKSGDKWGEAGSLDNIGFTYFKLEDYQQAINFCKKSLDISRSTGDKKGEANALLHLAEIYKQTKDWQQATSFCQESLQIRQAIVDKKGEAEILLFLTELQRANFSPDPVEKKAEKDLLFERLFKVLKIADEISAVDLLSKTHYALYETYKLGGSYEEAIKHLELHINIENELHKDTINQKVLNLEISARAEETKKEAEIFRLRNVELAGLYEESKKQKAEIEEQKKNVENTLVELKAAQSQLIQSEKMASLVVLIAGIAHEIQNPLNFVNNFSEVNEELLIEMKDELSKGKIDDAITLANDALENQRKINHHGKKADAIVKGMLQHSRSSNGVKEPTNINTLADEYLRLAYHGLRAKDKSFNVTMKTDYDESIGNINIIPQDIGKVMLNLINNAFYAASLPSKGGFSDSDKSYNPTVWVSTKKVGDKVLLSVKDNGLGIPQKLLDKIFQPFFTTKPTGQGTGLGLSLSYDIIKAHGGEIKVETKEREGAEFIIQLPNT
ncbi:MAG: tetratricopeptide repeat protein [Ferruginibacter sp.]